VNLLHWWNLVFLLPAVAALLYLLLMALGAAPSEGHDAHLELDGDGDVDAGAHVGAGDGHDGGDPTQSVLSLIGVGRIPLSLVLMSFAFLWGFFGWVGNLVFGAMLPSPALFIWPSLLLALVGAALLTRFLAFGLGRLLPATESYGAGARELVGRIADVRYPLTETSGTVQLYDKFGSLHEVAARVPPGEAAIPAGAKVVLWRWSEPAGAYFAVQDEVFDGTEAVGPRATESHRGNEEVRT
jgi:hypothetical protein